MRGRSHRGGPLEWKRLVTSHFLTFSFCTVAPLAAPPRIYFYTLTTLENIGANSVIHCSASGSPKPVVTWFDTNNEPIVPDLRKYEILKSGDLRIRNVTFDDMGKYKCMAENRYGRDMVDKIFFYPTDPNPTELERK